MQVVPAKSLGIVLRKLAYPMLGACTGKTCFVLDLIFALC